MSGKAAVEIAVDLPEGGVLAGITEVVREGLSSPFKELPPKYFYDERGSELFERITEQLAQGEGAAGRLLADPELYERVSQLTADISRIVTQLESGQGTAGQLLGDPRLYENVNLAAAELRSLLADIRSDPRKYLSVRLSLF